MSFYYSSPTVMPAPYPKWKYHATEPARQVRNEDEEKALGPEWSDAYIVQPYPKMLYKPDGEYKIVANPDEESKAGSGWSDKPPTPEQKAAAAEQKAAQEHKATPPAKK